MKRIVFEYDGKEVAVVYPDTYRLDDPLVNGSLDQRQDKFIGLVSQFAIMLAFRE